MALAGLLSLVTCLRQKRSNMEARRHKSTVDRFMKPINFALTTKHKCSRSTRSRNASWSLLDLVKRLSRKWVKSLSLPHRRSRYSNQQISRIQAIIKLFDMNRHASFLRPASVLARLLRKILPPLFEGCEANCGYAVPFHGISIPGTRRWKLLRETQDVRTKLSRLLRDLRAHLRLTELRFQPLLRFRRERS